MLTKKSPAARFTIFLTLIALIALIVSPAHAGAIRILLTEVNVLGTPDYVEALVVDDGNNGAGANISGWRIADFTTTTTTDRKIVGDTDNTGTVDIAVIARTGEFILFYDTTGIDETSSNGDSIIALYNSSLVFTSTEDEAVLYDSTPIARDAVVWSNRDGTPAAGWIFDFAGVIGLGMWPSAHTTQNATVIPRTGSSFTTGMSLQRSGVTDRDTYYDWGEASSTIGQPNTIGPPLLIAPLNNVELADYPLDRGGKLRLSWMPETGIANFKEYRIYCETYPLTDLLDSNTRPCTTAADSTRSSITITGTMDGESRFAAVTATDTYGLERRFTLNAASPATSRHNINGDFDTNGVVNSADLAALTSRYKAPALYNLIYDIGRNAPDGKIDEEDLFELARQYGY